jgi:hypothetical protein
MWPLKLWFRPKALRDPCDGEQPRWRGRHESSCADESRGSLHDGGCLAEKYALTLIFSGWIKNFWVLEKHDMCRATSLTYAKLRSEVKFLATIFETTWSNKKHCHYICEKLCNDTPS